MDSCILSGNRRRTFCFSGYIASCRGIDVDSVFRVTSRLVGESTTGMACFREILRVSSEFVDEDIMLAGFTQLVLVAVVVVVAVVAVVVVV